MLSAYKLILCCFTFSLIITYNFVFSDDIPVMLWNIQGNALHIKSPSALGRHDKAFMESLKDIHHQGSGILVFVLKKLSLEDFSARDKSLTLNNSTLYNIESFLDQHPNMILPSVKDPLDCIHKAHDVQEIVVESKIDDNIIKSVSSAMQKSSVVILHISDNGIISNEDELKSVFLPKFESSHKNVVGIFTGGKSSWGSPSNDHSSHIFRNLLATAPSDDNFVNYTGCIIMYAESASIKLGKDGNNSVTLPFPVDLEGSSCTNVSLLQLNFKTSGSLSSVTIKFNFTKTRGSWGTEGTVSTTGDKTYDDIDLNTESIEAPVGFSYSCGDLVMKARNSTYEITIKIVGFQIQPYEVKDVFSDSFDCVTFFTIPIWMGIFVSILFIVITNIGVYALFSVHTMDRFDDPKGKTISVAATAD